MLLTEVVDRLEHQGTPPATAMHGLWKDFGAGHLEEKSLNLQLDIYNLFVSQELTVHTKIAS